MTIYTFKTISMKLIVYFYFVGITSLFAQKVELGLGFGATIYKGEVSPEFRVRDSRPAINLFLRQNIDPVHTIRYTFLFANLKSSDVNNPSGLAPYRDARFSQTIFEVGGNWEYNFFNFRESTKTFKKLIAWTPYFSLGLGAFLYKPYKNGGTPISLIIPFGIGMKWAITKEWNIGCEAGARKTFTDKLDNVFTNEAPVLQRAILNDQDWYFYYGFSISYTFFSVNCPRFSSSYVPKPKGIKMDFFK